jgi:bifunctional UDP-N-acetylglucosamine pyrophosphorylase/glucosamine-1-phosphate N-acetyltransferase
MPTPWRPDRRPSRLPRGDDAPVGRAPDATGYGRVIRATDGTVERIVEQKDATAAEAAVTEINAGVYVFQAPALRRHLALVGTDNAQRRSTSPTSSRSPGRTRSPSRHPSCATSHSRSASTTAPARRGRAPSQRAHGAPLAARGRDDPGPGDDLDRRHRDARSRRDGAPEYAHPAGERRGIRGDHRPRHDLEDCEVGENATVRRSDATLAVIGAGATVGPFAYLRPGTNLAAGGKIGTFVETKNATIGEGSKVPHLSYIGDTTIGRGVNLGAGRSPRTTTTSRSTAPRSAMRCTPARTTCSSPR